MKSKITSKLSAAERLIIKMKKLLIPILLLVVGNVLGQTIAPAGTYTQNFDGIGITSTATLPSGWVVQNITGARTIAAAYTSVTGTATTLSNTYNVAMGTGATNGIYNFGNASASDRSVGGLSSGSASQSVNMFLKLTNSSATTSIPSFTVTYDAKRYRNGTNTAGFSIRLYYSTTGAASSWTEITAGALSFTGGNADNAGSTTNPSETKTATNIALAQSLAASGSIYFAWSYSVTSGSTTSNAQALGIDNITIAAVSATPTITGATTATAFTTTYGTASAAQSFSVSGSNLTANLIASAPTGFEVSADGTTYGSTATFTQSSGAASGTLRVRLAATAAVTGTSYNSQNISLASTGATTVNIATASSGNSVSAKGLTITGLIGANKVYDGLTTATFTGTAAYVGIVNGDSTTITGTPAASFATATVGTAKTITITGYTAPSSNYSLTQPSLTGNITVAPLTISGLTGANKVYDATASATYTGTPSYVGLVNSESASVSGTPSASFANAAVGNGKTITVSGYTTPSSNYSLTQPSLTGNITVAPLTITGVAVNNKAYDASTVATLSATGALSGVISADNANVTLVTSGVTASFADAGVATGKAVTVSGYTISGSASGNYSLSQPTGLTADITSSPSPAVSSALTASATYGTAFSYQITATNSPTEFNATGLPAGLNIGTATGIISGTPTVTGSFNISISATNVGGTGSATLVLTIGAKQVTLTAGTASNKIYNANLIASVAGASIAGVVGSDVVNVTATGTFATKTIGTAKTVNITYSLNGTDASKYVLDSTTSTSSADITAYNLSVTGATASNKEYDGTNAATITGSTLVGVFGGDTVTISTTGTFASTSIGTGIAVTSTQTLGGTDAGNYTVTLPTGLSANITTKSLTVTGATASNKSYDGTTSATITGATLASGIVSGDVVTVSATGTFNDKNVGTSKTVNLSYSLNGADAAKYTLASATGTTTANVTTIALTIAGAAVTTKVYDGTTAAAITGTLTGVLGSDVVNFASGSSIFNSATVGTGKTVTSVCSLSGTDSGNYNLTQPTGLTGAITKANSSITTAPTGTNITIGNALSTSTLSGGVGSPAGGTFAFTAPTTIPSSLGTASYSVTYTPTDTTNYNTITTTVSVTVVNGPTTLAAGDIAIIAFNSTNPDTISFVLLKAISSGTVFNVTDNGLLTNTSGRTSEGYLTYTAASDLPFGTVLTWKNGVTGTGVNAGWSSNAPTNFALNGTGDQMFIFQGNGTGSTTTTTNFGTQTAATSNTQWAAQNVTLIFGLNYYVALSSTSATSNTIQPSSTYLATSAFINLPTSAYANGYVTSNGSSTTTVSICGTQSTFLSTITTGSNWFAGAAALTFPTYTFTTPCPTPVITGTATATAFTTTYGTASTAQTFAIGGSNLTANIIANAPTGFQVSSNGTSWGSTATFTPTNGTASGTLSVRLAVNAAVSGTYNAQTITLTSTDATTINVTTAASGNAVTPLGITISVTANNKAYNGTTTATLGTPSYVGLANGETLSVTGTPVASFASANVGTGIAVSVSGYTAPSTNYTVSQPSGLTANITAVALTISGVTANNKAYDGTNAATLSGTPTYSGLVNGESFTVSETPTVTFASVNAGTGIAINIPAYTAPSANYTVTQPSLTANITAVALTISGVTANNKVYNGNTTAILSGTPAYEGLVNGQTFSVNGTPTASFASANVGTGINVSVAGYTAPTANYTVAQPTGLTANITAKELTISGLSVVNKQYDGTTTATLSGTPSLVGKVTGDDVNLIGTSSATFASSAVGTGIAVNVSGYSLSGSAASNYTLTQPSLSGDITSFPTPVITSSLTASATYGTVANDYSITATNSTTSFNASGLPTGLNVDTTTGVISGTPSAAPGIYSVTISATNLGGTTTASLSYTITPKSLSVSGASVANKVYNANNTASISGASLSGIVGSDSVSVGATGVFDNKNVGTGKTVTISYSLNGTDAAKYTLATATGTTTANIISLGITTTGATAQNKVYNNTTAATILGTTLVGVLGGDNVTISNTGTFAQATTGSGLVVTSTQSLSGTDAANYTLTLPTDLTGNITAANLTISGLAGVDKIYDGTTAASISGTPSLSGLIGSDIVTIAGTPTATFATATVGTGKAITVTGYTLSGADAGNYSISQPAGLTAAITITSQTITFGAIASVYSNAAPFALTAAASSGLTVSYTSSNTAVATVSGSTITIVGPGTTTITASQSGNVNYTAATSVQQPLTVTVPPFTNGNIAVFVAGASANNTTGSIVELNTTSAGQSAVQTKTLDSSIRFSGSATSTCYLTNSNDGTLLLFTGSTGSTSANANTLTSRFVGTYNNSGTLSTAATYTGSSGNQPRSATTVNNSTYFIGDQGGIYSNGTSAPSPAANVRGVKAFGGIVYAQTSLYSAATISAATGGSLSALSGVSSTNIASQQDFYLVSSAGNSTYDILYTLNATSATAGTITKYSLVSGSWTSNGSYSTSFGGFGLAAQKSGSGANLFVSTGAGATTANSVVKLIDTSGYNATISITTANNVTLYTAATGTIVKGIAFAPVLIAPVVTNTILTAAGTVDNVFTSYTITAINSPASFNATGLPSGLTVNTSTGVISGTPSVAGTFAVTISATNASGTDSKTLTITIAKANQTITFSTLAGKDISDADFALTATSTSSANPIVYTSSNTNIATISGSTVHIVGNTGNVTITASQVGNDNYNVASSVDQILTVSNALATNQVITFDALAAKTYGDANFNLSATSDSGLTVTFTSSNPAVATVSGTTVTVVGVGTTNITASQGGTNDVNPAPNVIRALVVNQKQLTIINSVVTPKPYDGTNTATVTGGTLSGKVGSDEVTFSGTATFNDVNANTNIAITTSYTLGGAAAAKYTLLQPSLTGTISKADQVITFATISPKTTADVDVALSATSSTSAINPVTFTSSDPSVLNVIYNATTLAYTLDTVAEGFATITASQAASANYNAANVNQTIIVRKVLYRNQFEGAAACPTQGNTPITAANTTGTAVSRNTMTCNSTGFVMNSTTLNNTATVSNTSYLEFAITAAAGYKMNLNSVSFVRQASNSAPNQLEVRYSTDGFATSTSWGAAPLSPTTGSIATWDFTDFTTVVAGTVTFRIYPYGTQRADLVTGTSAANGTFRIDDLTIDGTLVQLITWDGTSWSNGTGPTIADEAEINGNYNTTANGTFSAKKLTINSGLFTVKSGTILTVADQLVNSVTNTFSNSVQTAGFKIENNGNLIQTAATNTNVGDVVASRINASMKRLDYTYWSSPTVKSTYSLKNFSPLTMSLTSTPQGGASRFYTLSESGNAFEAVDPLATFFDTSNIAKGFSIRAPNNFPTNGTTATFNADFIGVPNNGTITIPVTYSGGSKGSNLIGNPYPSTIDALAFLQYTPDGGSTYPNAGTMYFWTHTTQAAGSANYASFNLSGGTASSLGGSAPNGTVQVGQGFLLKKSANATVVFNNSMRLGNNQGQFFRTATTEKHRIWLNLATETAPVNQMMIGYIEGTTLGFDDSYDGKLLNAGSSISSKISDENYVIQARPTPFENTDEVALNFKADTAGSFTLSVDHVDGLFLGEQNVYLRDNLLNVTHDLKVSAYTFTSEQGTFGDRFDVVYNNSTLNISTPTFDANSVIVYKNDNKVLNINAGKVVMKNVKIYDARGRMIYEQSNINSTTAVLNNLKTEQGVLLVKITSEDNKVVTKKVVY